METTKNASAEITPYPLKQGFPLQSWDNSLGIRLTTSPSKSYPQIRPPNLGARVKGQFGTLIYGLKPSLFCDLILRYKSCFIF